MTRKGFVCGLLFGGCVLLAVGCGGEEAGGPRTVDVSGTVTLDGKPLEGADVRFIGPNGKFIGYGRTGADGSYVLVQGAVPGTNKVYISKIEESDPGQEFNYEEGVDPGQAAAAMQALADPDQATEAVDLEALGSKQLIPDVYSDPSKTKLTFEVPEEGTNKANFQLTSQ
ncbi:MAG TPA: carboxypeptidase regulatory-like domain-containing protein [Planctomycetaceae bacterium]|nr:carboxypeptidase regulatory-like domain-containing protein [Planctomycetaceae bacterium]